VLHSFPSLIHSLLRVILLLVSSLSIKGVEEEDEEEQIRSESGKHDVVSIKPNGQSPIEHFEQTLS
jgi:hypothetical protein